MGSVVYFDAGGVRIHFLQKGKGEPVVLLHGFASDGQQTWGDTGWIDLLSASYRVIAVDCRGHGQSDKPHDPGAYTLGTVGDDVVRLLDHLEIRKTLLMGYSFGGRISSALILAHPERFKAVVLGGVGDGGPLSEPRHRRAIVDALLARESASIANPLARFIREFAERSPNDLAALAACMGTEYEVHPAEAMGRIRVPVLIVVGEKDNLAGSADSLARGIPGSRLVKLDGRDHLTAMVDPRFKDAVLDFFASLPA